MVFQELSYHRFRFPLKAEKEVLGSFFSKSGKQQWVIEREKGSKVPSWAFFVSGPIFFGPKFLRWSFSIRKWSRPRNKVFESRKYRHQHISSRPLVSSQWVISRRSLQKSKTAKNWGRIEDEGMEIERLQWNK